MSAIENLSVKKKSVIGKLLKDADPISKRVLTAFDPSLDSSVNISKLAKANRGDLDALGSYLKVPLVSKGLKKKLFSSREKLAKRIVSEIIALYPAVCSECSEEYAVMPGFQPKYRCWSCLHGAHDCESFTARMEIYEALPTQLSGLVWLCSDCIAVNKNNNIGECDEPPSGMGTPGHTKEINDNQARSDTTTSTEKSTYQNNSAPSLEVGKLTEELEKTKKEQEKSESKPNTCNHVCPRFCEGTCPHGISGKKAAEGKDKCELFHPKRCIRYMRHFTHETRGCKEGDNCAYLHVNLCTSSVETKKCKDVNCKQMHLAGTKRPKSMLNKKTVNLPGETVKTPSDQAPEKNPAKPKPVKSGTSSVQKQKKGGQSGPKKETSFLEMKSLLDETMTTVLGEIKSLRTEMSICKDQLVILMEDRIHSARERPATQSGLCNPMPCGTKQCHQPYQQRMKKYSDPVQSQQMFYPPNMTPIHPACC